MVWAAVLTEFTATGRPDRWFRSTLFAWWRNARQFSDTGVVGIANIWCLFPVNIPEYHLSLQVEGTNYLS
jgi:hypothetical protein